jgi:hypothetical protein
MLKEKYLKIFNETNSRKEFVAKVREQFPDLSTDTPRRYYSTFIKTVPQKTVLKEFNLSQAKKIKLEDMQRYEIKITYNLLKTEGFNEEEINKILEALGNEKTNT